MGGGVRGGSLEEKGGGMAVFGAVLLKKRKKREKKPVQFHACKTQSLRLFAQPIVQAVVSLVLSIAGSGGSSYATASNLSAGSRHIKGSKERYLFI